MPQKPLYKGGKKANKPTLSAKKLAAKAAKTKKGNPLQKAKRAKVAEVEKHNAELTKLVNARNEQLHAALAVGGGSRLAVVEPPSDDFVVGKKKKKTFGDLKAAIEGKIPAKKTV